MFDVDNVDNLKECGDDVVICRSFCGEDNGLGVALLLSVGQEVSKWK